MGLRGFLLLEALHPVSSIAVLAHPISIACGPRGQDFKAYETVPLSSVSSPSIESEYVGECSALEVQ